MKQLSTWGGFSAFYNALAYIIAILFFLVIFDYPNLTEPHHKLQLFTEKQGLVYILYLISYVFFGFSMVILNFSLKEKLTPETPNLITLATIYGYMWAGLLIASGLIMNYGISTVVTIADHDINKAITIWLAIESVALGLSSSNGEIIGGIWTFLVSFSMYQSKSFPNYLSYLGYVIAGFGLISAVPGLHDLTGIFGLLQIIWFIGLGVFLVKK